MRYWNQLNRTHLFGFAFIALFLFSCSNQNTRVGEEPVARAFDKYLYKSDIAKIVPVEFSHSDSIAFIENYTEQWVKRQLLLSYAEFNIDEERLDFTQMIDDYKASLIIHEYQKQLLSSKVDTILSENQIQEYYTRNLSNFVLKAPLVKALYVRIQKGNSKVTEIRDLLQSASETAFENLVSLCYQYADRFDFFDDKWVSFNLIVQNIPGSPDDHEAFLRSGALMEISDEEYIHFLQVHEYKLAEETAPLEYVFDRIKDLVITERRMDYLKELEESIYRDAVEKNDFELFEEKQTNEE